MDRIYSPCAGTVSILTPMTNGELVETALVAFPSQCCARRRDALKHVEGLWVTDAEHLNFPDASFDVVVAQYVITTVPNRALAEQSAGHTAGRTPRHAAAPASLAKRMREKSAAMHQEASARIAG
jgi:Methyltransferase domain